MTQVIRRRAGAAAPGVPAGQSSHVHTGTSAREIAMRELEQQNQRREQSAMGLNLDQVNRYRFRLQEGEEADIIVLDHSVDTAGFRYEHHMPDSEGRWTVFEGCPQEYDHCPLCDGIDSRKAGYVMFLTVLDLRGFTRQNGEFVPHYKRLMAVKGNLQPEFFKLSDAAVREHGTMRGMQLLMARDGTINSQIGHPIMDPAGSMYSIIPEDVLTQEFGHDEERDDEGVLRKPANYDITPFSYTQLFPRVTGEELRRRYGGGAPAGSRSDTEAEWGRGAGGHTPPRTRSRVGPGGGFSGGGQAQQRQDGPVQAGATAPRTRTRVGPAAATEGPAQASGGAPAPRTRTRAPAPQATEVRRRAAPAGVQNDLDDEIPF